MGIDTSPRVEEAMQAIREAWAETFPALAFDPDLAWRDSGADSLRSLQFMLRLEQLLDRKVPLDLLGRDTNVRTLARALATPEAVAGDERVPRIFLVPGAGGDEPKLADFRRAFGGRMRFETLALPDYDQPVAVLTDVAASARLLGEQVAARQPEGPVLLAGYSFGGILAAELAAQLSAQGRTIGLVCLLDPFLHYRLLTRIEPGEQGSRNHMLFAGNVLKRNPGQRLGAVWDRALFGVVLVLGLQGAARRRLQRQADALPTPTLLWRRQRLIARLRGKALRRWRARPVEAPAILVTSAEAYRHYDPLDWRGPFPQLEVIDVGGCHADLFRPDQLARYVPALERAAETAWRA